MKINKKIDNVYHIEFGLDDDRANARIYRYDTGQLIKFYDIPDGVEVQFSNEHSTNGTINKRIADSMVQIPDSLLTSKDNIIAYIKYIDENSETTTKLIKFGLLDRAKPSDYVSPDEEPSFRSFVEEQLKEAKETVEKNKDYLKETIENTEKSKEYMDATDANRRTVEGLTEKNKEYATQTESNAESANTSASNASESASNASQSASNAKGSADNASLSAKEAKDAAVKAGTSESNAKEAENNINSAVTEFEQTKRESLTEIGNLTTNSKKEISDLTDEKKAELNKINDDITQNAGELKEAIVNAADAKKEEINQKGLEVLASIPEEFSKVEDTTLIKPTESGTEMMLTDSSDMNIQELHIYGRTEQAGTTGANLFNVNDKLNWNSVFSADSEGWISAIIPANTGTTDTYYTFDTKKSDLLKPSTTYLAVMEFGMTLPNKLSLIAISPDVGASTKSQFKGYASFRKKSVTVCETINSFENANVMCKGYIQVKPGFTGGSVKFRFSLIADTSMTIDKFKYEPYTGGQPSPNPDYPQEIVSVENPKLNISGKNILKQSVPTVSFDKNTKVTKLEESENKIKIKINEVGEYIYISIPLKNIIKEIKANKAYTIVFNNATQISNCFFGSGNATIKLTNYAYCKENKVVLKTLSELPNNPKQYYIYIGIYNKKGNIAGFDDITVFEGDYSDVNINSTEPYKPLQTATLNYELNAIDNVKDELVVKSDGTGQLIQKWKRRIIDDSVSPYIDINPKHEVGVLINILAYRDATNTQSDLYSLIYSDKLTAIKNIYDEDVVGIGYTTTSDYVRLRLPVSIGTTDEEIKNYLEQNPIEILYLLKEPIVTELSSEEVQKILALHTNKPNTTIWNDQNAEMQVTYVADTKSYIDNKFKELSNAIVASASEAE